MTKNLPRTSKEYVRAVLEDEGIEYGLVHYSEFPDYEDEEFHRLREQYLDARQQLLADENLWLRKRVCDIRQQIVNHLGMSIFGPVEGNLDLFFPNDLYEEHGRFIEWQEELIKQTRREAE